VTDDKNPIPLEQELQAFESGLLLKTGGPKSDLAEQWSRLRSRIDEILNSGSPPHIRKTTQLPILLVATPEIVSLPEHMGNLSNIIRTGDGGGLADISSAVVTELYRQGVNVHVTLPHYRNLFATLGKISDEEYRALIRGVQELNRIHFIDHGLFEGATRVYDERSRLRNINLRKANAFMEGIIYGLLPRLKADNPRILIHCNDWMTGLLPAAAASQHIPSLLTCHNIFTAKQSPHDLLEDGIDIAPFEQGLYYEHHPDSFPSREAHYTRNLVDFLTSGLYAASRINTVSPTFLEEMVRGDFRGIGLIPEAMGRVINDRHREDRASGILNAPTVLADPRVDPFITRRYGWKDFREGKDANKLDFQDKMGLTPDLATPLFYWPHRLASPQKGAELLLAVAPSLIHQQGPLQFAVVANGQSDLVDACHQMTRSYPGTFAYRPFTRELSQLGKAASDFILCPSLYEPCGIPQVEGPRYGTLPVVRRTGGLADTVFPLDRPDGNGFVFDRFEPGALGASIREALAFYRAPIPGRDARLAAIIEDSFGRFTIAKTVSRYIELYEDILGEKVV
jgi:ADP-glucose type glycogen/starch synthase